MLLTSDIILRKSARSAGDIFRKSAKSAGNNSRKKGIKTKFPVRAFT